MRKVYDSTNPADIPVGVERLGYCDGIYGPGGSDPNGWTDADLANCLAQIATQPGHDRGQIIDVERFDISPQQAPGEVQRRRDVGIDPTVYVSFNAWAGVRQIFQALNVTEPHYLVADYDNNPTIPQDAIGKQYQNSPLSGGHYDVSNVVEFWPGVDSKSMEDGMQTFFIKAGDPVLWIPGPNQITLFNLVADKSTVDVQLYATNTDGKPVPLDPAKTGFQLQGNLPNVHGPIQVFGSLADLGVSGPVTLGVQVT